MKAKCSMAAVSFIRLFYVFFVIVWAGACLAVGNKNIPSSCKKVYVNEMIYSLYGRLDASISFEGASSLGKYGFYPIDSKCRVYRCFVCDKRVECNTSADLRVFLEELRIKDSRSKHHNLAASVECIFNSCCESDSESHVSKEYIIKYIKIVHILEGKSLFGEDAEKFMLSNCKDVLAEPCLSEDLDLGWINTCCYENIDIPVNHDELEKEPCDDACSCVNEQKQFASSQIVEDLASSATAFSKMLDLDSDGDKGSQINKRAISYPMYTSSSERLGTFATWDFPNMVSPEIFVAAGFFYKDEHEVVCCFHCGVCMCPEGCQDPLAMHSINSLSCEFLKAIDVRKYFDLVQSKSDDAKLLVTSECLEAEIDTAVNNSEEDDNIASHDADYLLGEIMKLSVGSHLIINTFSEYFRTFYRPFF